MHRSSSPIEHDKGSKSIQNQNQIHIRMDSSLREAPKANHLNVEWSGSDHDHGAEEYEWRCPIRLGEERDETCGSVDMDEDDPVGGIIMVGKKRCREEERQKVMSKEVCTPLSSPPLPLSSLFPSLPAPFPPLPPPH